MVLEVTMTQSKNDNLQKPNIGQLWIWKTNRESEKEKIEKNFNIKTSGTRMLILFFDFFIISKKMITKEIIMGASVFISANGYMRACARMFARACARAERRFRRNCAFFCDSVLQFLHTLCQNTPTWSLRTQIPGPLQRPAGSICTPTMTIWIYQLIWHGLKSVRNDWNFPWLNWTQRLPRRWYM